MGISFSSHKNHRYGWKKDTYDERDLKVKFSKKKENLPVKIDLRSKWENVYTQGELGSCTSNAICSAFTYDQNKQHLEKFEPSRLFLYYNERNMEGTPDYDSGATIRDGIQAINTQGLCDESLWPYDIKKFTEKPSDNCYMEAKYHKCIKYRRISKDINQLKAALCNGLPFVFGFNVYDSFENSDWNPSTHIMPQPKESENVLGGHAVCAVGYSDNKKCFLVRNSWGEEWGIGGYFLMGYDFIVSSDCDDFWIIETVEDKEEIVSSEKEETTTSSDKIEDHDDTDYTKVHEREDRDKKRIRDKIKKNEKLKKKATIKLEKFSIKEEK
jgi:C1A family cysteine protease